jgi:hypothetical protein
LEVHEWNGPIHLFMLEAIEKASLQSLKTCYSKTWLWVVTTTITLTKTLSILGGLNANVLELVGFVLNVFYILTFLEQS